MTKRQEKNQPLIQFFTRWLSIAFSDVHLFDRTIVHYIADILSRFARSENLYRIKRLPRQKLETAVEMLLEAELRSRPSEPEFDPFAEREIRKHMADFALFMTGFFREYVQHIGTLDLYFQKGSESYRKVYEFDTNLAERHADIFRQLHNRFIEYSGGINYMKKVYFTHKLPPQLSRLLIFPFNQN